jgi:hypothetical protein
MSKNRTTTLLPTSPTPFYVLTVSLIPRIHRDFKAIKVVSNVETKGILDSFSPSRLVLVWLSYFHTLNFEMPSGW